MSNKANKIRKNIIKKPDPLYNSLIGSIVMTVGITTGKTEQQCKYLFKTLRKNSKVLGNTVEDIVEYVWTVFGNNDLIKVRSNYVLVYDKLGVRSPMVSFTNDDGNLMPLRQDGFKETNILSLAAEGRDWAEAEFLYDEDGKPLTEDTDNV